MKTYNFRNAGSAHIYIGYLLGQGYDFRVKVVSSDSIVVICPKACAPPPHNFLRPEMSTSLALRAGGR
jgi:hypothetical protein